MSLNPARKGEDASGRSTDRVKNMEVNHGVFTNLTSDASQPANSGMLRLLWLSLKPILKYPIAPTFTNVDHVSINGGAYTAGSPEDAANYLQKALPAVTQGDIAFHKAKSN